MLGQRFNLWFVLALLVAAAAGCKKSEPAQKPAGQSPQSQAEPYTNTPPGELLARIHWLGKKRIAADPSAAAFMAVWNLPESQKLEAQTLDKLALAPWDLPRSDTNLPATISTNVGSALLRPLLDDFLQEESYLEIRQLTNQPTQAVLAIHLDDSRAALWTTNINSLARLQFTALPSTISNLTTARAGQWTLLNFGDNQSPLLADITARVHHSNTPFPPNLTNFWLDAQLDLKRLLTSTLLSTTTSTTPLTDTNVGVTWPTNITFTVIGGNGGNVLTRADADFAQSLPIELEPWNVPTNLIHDPLIGFSAIRGFRPLLKAFKPWNDLQLGTPPNQAYTFAQHGVPWLRFAIIPSLEASNQVDRLADFAERELNPKMTASRVGGFAKLPGTQHLKWQGVPIFSPDLNWTNFDGNPYILAGFFARPLTNQPAPSELFPQFVNSPDTIWYDWEFSKESLLGWTPIYQLVRHVFNLPRFGLDPEIAWTTRVAEHLGNSVSILKLETPTNLSFIRQSSAGLTGPELLLFLDWLQSPTFPHGLYTFLAPPPHPAGPPTNAIPQPAPQPTTNSPAEPKKP